MRTGLPRPNVAQICRVRLHDLPVICMHAAMGGIGLQSRFFSNQKSEKRGQATARLPLYTHLFI